MAVLYLHYWQINHSFCHCVIINAAFKMGILKLLHSPSEEDYEAVAEGVKAVWCEAFLEYFEMTLDLDIKQNAGRWNLEN